MYCDVGYYSAYSAPSCSSCIAGSYTATPGLSTCTSCSTGYYAPSNAATECMACPNGTAQAATGQSSCSNCVAGRFAATKGLGTCSNCAAGKRSAAAAFKCADCKPGTYSSAGVSWCTNCSIGFIAASSGSDTCTACSAGKYIDEPKSTSCKNCPKGRNQPATGQDGCVDCVIGKYASSTGSVTCTRCPSTYSSFGAAVTCTLADLEYYIDPVTEETENCPVGATCLGNTATPRPDKGYWVDRALLGYQGKLIPCTRNTCIGANKGERDTSKQFNRSCWTGNAYNTSWLDGKRQECDSDALQCLEGSSGPLCGSCTDEYVYTAATRVCIPCTGDWRSFSSTRGRAAFILASFTFAIGLSGLLYFEYIPVPRCLKDTWLFGTVRFILGDSGTMRVLW